jgi:hypothetical protein
MLYVQEQTSDRLEGRLGRRQDAGEPEGCAWNRTPPRLSQRCVGVSEMSYPSKHRKTRWNGSRRLTARHAQRGRWARDDPPPTERKR